jgi:hypothetical protein
MTVNREQVVCPTVAGRTGRDTDFRPPATTLRALLVRRMDGSRGSACRLKAQATSFVHLLAWYRALGEVAPDLDDVLPDATARHKPVLVGGRVKGMNAVTPVWS